jgi:hypothetical protein
LEFLGYSTRLTVFREVFWYLLSVQIFAVFVAVKVRSQMGLLLAIVLPMLWMFHVVGHYAPGSGS